MSLITNKQIIAVLLIPIILIAFATPCFAADSSTGSVDFATLTQKVFNFISGFINLIFQVGDGGQTEEPGVAGSTADLGKSDFITALSNITGGFGEFFDKVLGIFFTSDPKKPDQPIDFNELLGIGNNDDKDEEKDKPDITDDNNNVYSYTYSGKNYKIAVSSSELSTTLNEIKTYNLNQSYAYNNGYDSNKNRCNEISNYHIFMLLNINNVANPPSLSDALNASATYRGDKMSGKSKACSDETIVNLKTCIDNKQPCRVHVNTKKSNGDTGKHWVTCVGYTGEAKNISDYLFIGSWSGKLMKGKEAASSGYIEVNKFETGYTGDNIRTFN